MKSKVWAMLLGALLLLCVVLSVVLMHAGEPAAAAEIWSKGKLLKRVSLSVDDEFIVETDGGSNTVTVRDGKIAVTAASCPDRHCMNRGFCNGGAQIVCLPNGLVIKFTGKQDTDAVAE